MRKFINYSLGDFRKLLRYTSDLKEFIRGDIDLKEIPRNKVYERKKGKKRDDEKEAIDEALLESNKISINRITGNTTMMKEEENGVGWEDVNVLSLVRSAELLEDEKREILESGFKEPFLLVAKKIKTEWSKGLGRPTIVENLKAVKGASDGNVGKVIAALNRARKARKKGLNIERGDVLEV
jgi:hypothetical protein